MHSKSLEGVARVDNSWKLYVTEAHGQSPAAREFIKDVEAHLATYRALREATAVYPDPKDTYLEVDEIRVVAEELGRLLMRAKRPTLSALEQGAALRELDAPDPPHRFSPGEVASMAGKLVGLSRSALTWMGEVKDDADTKRRGWHKNSPRKNFVYSVCDSYQHRFGEIANAGNERFAAILIEIVSPLGIPHENLHRLIKDSTPPA